MITTLEQHVAKCVFRQCFAPMHKKFIISQVGCNVRYWTHSCHAVASDPMRPYQNMPNTLKLKCFCNLLHWVQHQEFEDVDIRRAISIFGESGHCHSQTGVPECPLHGSSGLKCIVVSYLLWVPDWVVLWLLLIVLCMLLLCCLCLALPSI